MKNSLDELGLLYKTDKSSARHNYLQSYEEFIPFKRDAEFTFLEVGVLRGASVRMWADWFPNASIIGLDVKPPKVFKIRDVPKNLALVAGDATLPQTVKRLSRKFNAPSIVLDDGSHWWDQQRKALELIWPWLKPGGIYIVEDLQSSSEPGFAQEDVFSFVDLMLRLAASLHLRGSELDRFRSLGPEWFVNLAQEVRSVNFIPGAVLLRKK